MYLRYSNEFKQNPKIALEILRKHAKNEESQIFKESKKSKFQVKKKKTN